MNTQSLVHNTNSDLSYLADTALSGIGHSYMLKTRFGIGEGYNKYDYFALKTLSRLLCEGRCDFTDEEYEDIRMSLQRLTFKYET